MLVTLLGIVTLVREGQSKKALEPMLVTPDLISTVFILSLYVSHDESVLVGLSVISPVPLIVSVPFSSSDHVRLSPHLPDDAISLTLTWQEAE